MSGTNSNNTNGISISVELQMPSPGSSTPARVEESPEDRLNRALELIDSGHESAAEWKMVRNLNNKLMRKRERGSISDRELNALQLLQPMIEKYGQFDSDHGVEQDPSLHSSVTGGSK